MEAYHPATRIPFNTLYAELQHGVEKDKINIQRKVSTSGTVLEQYTYSRKCVFEKSWDCFTKIARGIILCPDQGCVVAYTFPKFFNLGENGAQFLNEPYELFHKYDGSLIIVFYWEDEWHFATKGSFYSDQAIAAKVLADEMGLTKCLKTDNTYLFELIGPDNKIVVNYENNDLVMLGGYNPDGMELDFKKLPFTTALKYSHSTEEMLVKSSKHWASNFEGVVVRFESGYRLKIKGDEYKRLHSALSKVTPLHVWELMSESYDKIASFRQEIPEEFWADFDSIFAILKHKLVCLMCDVTNKYFQTEFLTDKELGIWISKKDKQYSLDKFIFPWRKHSGKNEAILADPKLRRALFNEIRPKNNVLPGYSPSFGLKAIQDGNS